MNKEEPQSSSVGCVRISADADAMHLSHVLELKNIFRKHPGKTKIEINFCSGQAKIGSLFIDSSWGVEPSPELVKILKEVTSLTNVSLDAK